jgi:hypothetical protein
MKPLTNPRLLSVFAWAPSERHRGVMSKDCVIDIRKGYIGRHEFWSGDQLIATLANDHLTIHAGYASDLCSPAIKVCGIWFGTPTSEREALAAFAHDCLRQILMARLKCCPWSRKDTDDIFFDLLRDQKSRFSSIYHGAVAGFLGDIFMKLTASKSDITCRPCKPPRL